MLRVVEAIHEGRQRNCSTGILYIDIAKAFDKVWHSALILKLKKFKIPPKLIQLLYSYLRDRHFKVRYNSTYSTSRKVRSSVPQGSLLGPVLFNIFLNDIPRHDGTSLALYADDTAIVCTHHNLSVLHRNIQDHIHELEYFFSRWRIKLNASKSVFVLYTSKRKIPFDSVRLQGHNIPISKNAKYLGVQLDKNLTWNLHITHAIKKFHAVRNSLNPILNSYSVALSTKLLLFNVALRPILIGIECGFVEYMAFYGLYLQC